MRSSREQRGGGQGPGPGSGGSRIWCSAEFRLYSEKNAGNAPMFQWLLGPAYPDQGLFGPSCCAGRRRRRTPGRDG